MWNLLVKCRDCRSAPDTIAVSRIARKWLVGDETVLWGWCKTLGLGCQDTLGDQYLQLGAKSRGRDSPELGYTVHHSYLYNSYDQSTENCNQTWPRGELIKGVLANLVWRLLEIFEDLPKPGQLFRSHCTLFFEVGPTGNWSKKYGTRTQLEIAPFSGLGITLYLCKRGDSLSPDGRLNWLLQTSVLRS